MSWAEAAFISAVVIAVMAAISVTVWQVTMTMRTRTAAKSAIARDEAYRGLAEQVATALTTTADEQERIADELTDLRGRLGAIEKLLREVE
ncbi:MAG: hypothetical protein ACRDJW_20070 [Thermomicrobiales bacterium]